MQRPGIRWRWQKIDRSRIPGIAHIHHRDTVAKHVTDIGMLSMDHDLHPISSPSLIGVSHKVNVFAWSFKRFMIHTVSSFFAKYKCCVAASIMLLISVVMLTVWKP